jgi:hypothetical protein
MNILTAMLTPIWMQIEHPGRAARLVVPQVSGVIGFRVAAYRIAGE